MLSQVNGPCDICMLDTYPLLYRDFCDEKCNEKKTCSDCLERSKKEDGLKCPFCRQPYPLGKIEAYKDFKRIRMFAVTFAALGALAVTTIGITYFRKPLCFSIEGFVKYQTCISNLFNAHHHAINAGSFFLSATTVAFTGYFLLRKINQRWLKC